jgi:hypothetical protein
VIVFKVLDLEEGAVAVGRKSPDPSPSRLAI